MKKGMVVYVTAGKEDVVSHHLKPDLPALKHQDLSAVCVATSEDEVAYGWWQMIARGMHQVSLMTAAYDAASGQFEPHGTPVRLWG